MDMIIQYVEMRNLGVANVTREPFDSFRRGWWTDIGPLFFSIEPLTSSMQHDQLMSSLVTYVDSFRIPLSTLLINAIMDQVSVIQ